MGRVQHPEMVLDDQQGFPDQRRGVLDLLESLGGRLGNVVQLSSGTTSQRTYDYTEWGIQKGGTDNLPFSGRDRARWKGALLMGADSTLYYMRNRWYEAGTDRFLSEDPAGLIGGNNPVVFAAADPINLRDPGGRSCEGIWLVGEDATSSSGTMKEITFNYTVRFVGWSCKSEQDVGYIAFAPFAIGTGPAQATIANWGQFGSHVWPDHVLGIRGGKSLFADMDPAKLRYILRQTADKGKFVNARVVAGEVRYAIAYTGPS